MLKLEQLAELLEKNRAAASARVKEFSIGDRPFAFNSCPAIMGVINLSADSWYRESVCLTADAAIKRGKVLNEQGAEIVDLGAESTLAHATRVDAAGQNSKLLPVIQALRKTGVLVSVETYQPAVTRACLEAGANILNLTGTDPSDELFRLVAGHDAAVIICHVQGTNVREVGDYDLSADPIPMMYEYFARQIEIAQRNGIEKIFLDPGLGFYYRNLQDSAVRVRHQMNVFLNSFRLRTLGFPVCHALPHAFEYFGDEVRCAEPFFAVLAALGKTDLFRTHEVPRIKAVLDTMKAFYSSPCGVRVLPPLPSGNLELGTWNLELTICEMTQNDVLQVFRDTGALLEGHFVLRSGLHSRQFFQCALALQQMPIVEKLGAALAAKVKSLGAVTVVSPAMGGLVIGQEVARQLGLRFIFVEKEEGKLVLRRGFKIAPGEKTLVVEDVVTKGGRVQETMDIVRAHSGNVLGVAMVVDRSNGQTQLGVPMFSLLALQVEAFDPDKLPPDLAKTPAVKPGSK